MATFDGYTELERMRSYSTIFSSTSFSKLLKVNDLEFINSKVKRFDETKLLAGEFITYSDYIHYVYSELSKKYRNEYFYKNSFINYKLLKEYGVKDTVVVNEFKVGNSIADIVLFNGSSKAFEIKTELDSNRRLQGQIADYTKVFDYCYIITDASLIDKYLCESDILGVIALDKLSRTVKLTEIRKAGKNDNIDPETLMRCIRTSEYKNIVTKFYGELPDMNSFNMFEICSRLIRKIPPLQLRQLFLNEIKTRKSNTSSLKHFKKELRQVALAMQLDERKYQKIISKLNEPINL
jgi:hypothetical protein